MTLDDFEIGFAIEDNIGDLKIASPTNKIQKATPWGLFSDP